MADNSIESQGTELFLSLDGTTVLKFDCPTALNGIGFTAGEIPNNCLDSVTETSRPGRKKLNAFSVPFIVQEGSEAHEYVLDLVNNATAEVPYAIALSNGTDDPTLTAGAFVAPGGVGTETRTIAHGTGRVSGVTVDINDGDLVRGSFTFLPETLAWVYKA